MTSPKRRNVVLVGRPVQAERGLFAPTFGARAGLPERSVGEIIRTTPGGAFTPGATAFEQRGGVYGETALLPFLAAYAERIVRPLAAQGRVTLSELAPGPEGALEQRARELRQQGRGTFEAALEASETTPTPRFARGASELVFDPLNLPFGGPAGPGLRAVGTAARRGATEALVRAPGRVLPEAGVRLGTGRPGIAGAAAKEPWQMTRAEFVPPVLKRSRSVEVQALRERAEILHERAVAQAITEGKPVSPEVLADYPALAPGAKSAAAKGAEPAVPAGQARAPQAKPPRVVRRSRVDPAYLESIGRKPAAEPLAAELPREPLIPVQEGGDLAFEERFIRQTRITGRATDRIERIGLREPDLPFDPTNWKAYSRAQGFTEEEIGQYQKMLDLYDEGIKRGYSEGNMATLGAHEVNFPLAAEPAPGATLERGAGMAVPAPPPLAAGKELVTPEPAAAVSGAPPPVPPVRPPAPPTGGEEFAANIRLSKYPEDIRAPIREWATAHADEVQEARRGTRSDAQALADARALVEEMGGDFAKVQRRWKPGEAWNAEEVLAIRGVLREKTNAALQAAQVARTDNSAANHANLLLAMQEQARVQEIVHGVTAEAGRALRAFRQEAFDAISANDTRKLEELLRRLGDRAKLDDVATALSKLDINNPVAVNEFLRNASKPTFWDYVMELYINGLLSGPKTHIVNALSNTVNALVSPVERGAAAGVERIVAPLQRRQVERFFSEVSADSLGAMEGIREGARAGLDTLKNGINPTQLSKWEFRRTAFRGNLGRVIRAPGTALEAADAMGYAINYRAALNAGILRQARSEGLRGQALVDRIAELKLAPTEQLIKGAQETAEYRLFRNESQFANAILDFRTKYPAARFVIPFVRTPVNLVKFGLERSPLGFINPQLWRNLAVKNPEASDQLARAFLGSTLAALVAWQFAEGRITGAAPKSAAEQDRFYREGKLPYALRVGDTWIQYQRLEPFNQPLAQVAAAIEALEAKDKTATEKVQKAIYTMGQNLVSQTFLSGLNSVLNALTEPERYGPTFLARQAASLVPFSSALRTAGQALDPTFRRPRTLAEQLQAGLPGLSKNVPPVLTAFGEEAPRESPAISPIQITPAQQSAIDAELGRLGVEVGFVGKSIGGVELNREQQAAYQRLAGQLTKQALAQLVASPSYQRASDLQKEAALERIINLAREQARRQLLPSIVEGLKAQEQPSPTPVPTGMQSAPGGRRNVVMVGAP